MVQRQVTPQTVRIARGSHIDPRDGACVMELASMLAGERFSDRPRAVCPVIAAFLRAYNDAVDDKRREDLYPIASAVVGTSTSDPLVIAERVHLIAEWGQAQLARRGRRRFFGHLRPASIDECQGREIGPHAVRAARPFDDAAHASALALVQRLTACGQPGPSEGPSCPARSLAHPPGAALPVREDFTGAR